MTTADFEKIALWMGWTRQDMPNGVSEWWGLDAEGFDDFKGYMTRKRSLTDVEAVEALNRLVEKGYLVSLSGGNGEFSLDIAKVYKASVVTEIVNGETNCPTIHAVVEAALLQLIAAEGGKEAQDGRFNQDA